MAIFRVAFRLFGCFVAFQSLQLGCVADGLKDIVEPEGRITKANGDKFAKPGTEKQSDGELIDWQRYFQRPPDSVQRSQLEQRVQRWSDPVSSEDKVAKGKALLALGRLHEAEANFRGALRDSPDNLEAWIDLAGVYARKNDAAKLLEVLGEVDDRIALRSEVSPALRLRIDFLKASGLALAGRPAESRSALSALIGSFSDFTPAYVALANSYLASGEDSLAEFIAKRAQDRGKEDPGIENILGVVAMRRNDSKAAQTHFNRALELAPTYGQALVNRATIWLRDANLSAAEDDVNKATTLDPNNANALVVRAIVMRRTGRSELARASLERALEIEPLNVEARYNLAVLHATEMDKPEVALRLFEEVISLPGISREMARRAERGLLDLKAMM